MQFDETQSFAPYDPGPLESPFLTIMEILPIIIVSRNWISNNQHYEILQRPLHF